MDDKPCGFRSRWVEILSLEATIKNGNAKSTPKPAQSVFSMSANSHLGSSWIGGTLTFDP